MKPNYIIFFDNDGVTSSWQTWGNKTYIKSLNPSIGDIDFYKWNAIDRLMDRISNEYDVIAICISTWKQVLYDEDNVRDFTKFANLRRIKIANDIQVAPKFSYHEPWERLKVIKQGIKKYKPVDYIILEDEFGQSIENEGYHNVIKTDKLDGFCYKHFLEMGQIVDKWQLKEEYIKGKEKYEQALSTLLSCSI